MNQENFQVAVKAVLYARGKYLLLFKSEKEDISPTEWDIPGGRVKFGEELKDALKREAEEETAITIEAEKIFPIKTWSMKKPDFQLVGIDFLCVLENIQEPKISAEHARWEWRDAAAILDDDSISTWLKDDIKKAEAVKGIFCVDKIDKKEYNYK